MSHVKPVVGSSAEALERALRSIEREAARLDRVPEFPRDAFAELREAGVLTATLGGAARSEPVAEMWAVVRAVSAADASVGRILDGHLNAVERLELATGNAAAQDELERLAFEERILGVWGADPAPAVATPARLLDADGGMVISGAKAYCSGAGGVDAALVMVGNDTGQPPALVLVTCDDRVEVDRSWYRAAGMRASESHLVRFHDAPAARIGEPGELAREPWFSRDALRTAACWAGMVDSAAVGALDYLAAHRSGEELSALAAGRIEAARGTVDAWIARAAAAVDRGDELRALSVQARIEIARAAGVVLDAAASACGSVPFVEGGRLDRARRDLETFLLQHRLDPLLVRIGRDELERR